MSNDPLHDVIQELESLKRVYHRLVETPAGPPFYNVIAQLLPRLLSRIGQNHQRILKAERESPQFKELLDNIHKKYLDMLTHIMKRVRPDEACKIPCVGIVDLLVNGKLEDPYFYNFNWI
jgi:proteasome component ECM29